MSTMIERAADLLFPESGRQTLNIKFFCGGDDNVTALQLAEQVVRAETQIRGGSARLVERIDS
ncbi:hypothetical protein [Allosphingosinicella deserti]|uniref:Uncharacterized protein n=1 Tax=Allosphingosinicella deserti TaxID=2116704 RepID=A0A2P7QVZ2_9SPHN|nr:hypothetical protein [Sphingomonas deserti]PSJ42138.1 hypothetical protein C7I55_07850 [Sphingomonas deserti]